METSDPNAAFFTDEGHLNDHGLAIYTQALHDHRLEELDETLIAHVEDCPECKKEVYSFFHFCYQYERDTGTQPVRKSFFPGSFLKYAAILLILFSVVVVLYFLIPPQTTKIADITGQKDTIIDSVSTMIQRIEHQERPIPEKTTRQTEKPQYAAAFKANDELEALIDVHVRSTNIEIMSPSGNPLFRDSLVFQWKPYPQKLTLSLRNNTNEEIFISSVKGESYVLKEQLQPGLYYWLLESKKGVVYVGKFHCR